MKVTFGVEPLAFIWDEMIANAHRHWEETAMFAAGEVFAPKYERFAQYGDRYVTFAVRDAGVKLVGHCGMYLVESMHTQKLLATEDSWYLLPEYRRGRLAIDFHRFVKNEMVRRGATKITMTAAPYNGACRIMEYLGYKLDCYEYSLDLTSQGAVSSPIGADSADESPLVTETV